MTKLILAAAFLLSATWGKAQNNDKFHFFDINWKPSSENTAFIERVRKLKNDQFLITKYTAFGPRLSQEVCKDKGGTKRNGFCRYYHANGYQDSAGFCIDNLPARRWWYYDNKGNLIKTKLFDNGVVIQDSALINLPPNFIANFDQEDDTRIDTTSQVDFPSTYNGGVSGWLRFLVRNLRYPQRAIDAGIQGQVMVLFLVDKKGKTQNPDIIKSVEYTLDEEAMRLITESPEWKPALQHGEAVKSSMKQQIIFRFEYGKK